MLTTLGFRYPPSREPPVIGAIRQYLSGWPGVGRMVADMARQQNDLRLTRCGQSGWEATFYPAGIGHFLTPMVGTRWAREPSAQRAAWGLRAAGMKWTPQPVGLRVLSSTGPRSFLLIS